MLDFLIDCELFQNKVFIWVAIILEHKWVSRKTSMLKLSQVKCNKGLNKKVVAISKKQKRDKWR